MRPVTLREPLALGMWRVAWLLEAARALRRTPQGGWLGTRQSHEALGLTPAPLHPMGVWAEKQVGRRRGCVQ